MLDNGGSEKPSNSQYCHYRPKYVRRTTKDAKLIIAGKIIKQYSQHFTSQRPSKVNETLHRSPMLFVKSNPKPSMYAWKTHHPINIKAALNQPLIHKPSKKVIRGNFQIVIILTAPYRVFFWSNGGSRKDASGESRVPYKVKKFWSPIYFNCKFKCDLLLEVMKALLLQ